MEQKNITKDMTGYGQKADVKELAVMAMFIALTYAATAFINVPSPIPAAGGLVHLGNVPLIIGAVLFGKKTGWAAGAFGMALFDITSSWVVWAPFTFVIAGLMGIAVGFLTEKKKTASRIVLAMAAALLIKIAGYYIAEGIITGNWMAPMYSIPGNIIQVTMAAVISLPLIVSLKAALKR